MAEELNLENIAKNVEDPAVAGLLTFLDYKIEFKVSGDESRLCDLITVDPIARYILMEVCLRVTVETKKVNFVIATDAAVSSVELFRDAFGIMKDYPDTVQVGAAGSNYHAVVFSDPATVYAHVWRLPS